MTTASHPHRWQFFRAGGSDQVALERGADILAIGELDPKLWVALACPVNGLEFDPRTLALMDSDGDLRIRIPDVIAAVKWTGGLLKDADDLLKGGDLSLSAINETSDEGKQLVASARQILKGLGKDDSPSITVADTMETARVFEQMRFNGDGVVPVESVDEGPDRRVAEEIVAALGSATDRSGMPGVDRAKLDAFFAAAAAFDTWWKQGESDATTLLPLGEATPDACTALTTVRGKIDDYFARSRLAAFDSRSLAALNRQESEYLAIAAADMSITAEEIAGFPVSRVEAGKPLGLVDGINPAWSAAIARFRSLVVDPMLGAAKTALTEQDWADLKGRFAAYEAWVAGKAGAMVEPLGIVRVREILNGGSKAALEALIAQDAALEPEMTAISSVERLARYQRDLYQLLNNFVAFRDFYSRERPAVFQAGTLFLDGRSCALSVRVADPAKHAVLAGLSKCFLAYCDCTRPSGEKLTIAAAFTDGDSDNLMVGRNGVFFDRQGRDWDATITRVVENPISVRQAFWAPYKKLVRLIEEQVAKRAAAGEASTDSKLQSAAATTANADSAKPAEPKKIDVGTVAALGVAFGALATATAAFAGYLSGVLTLPFWQVVLAFAALLVLLSTPSMLIAWIKLRQRNLGPILDANGWAVNGRVKMNVPFGGALTKVAELPKGARQSLAVRYPEPPTLLPKLIFALIGLGFVLSLLNHLDLLRRMTGGRFGSPPTVEMILPADTQVEVPADAGSPAPDSGS